MWMTIAIMCAIASIAALLSRYTGVFLHKETPSKADVTAFTSVTDVTQSSTPFFPRLLDLLPTKGQYIIRVILSVLIILAVSYIGWLTGVLYYLMSKDAATVNIFVAELYDAAQKQLIGLRVTIIGTEEHFAQDDESMAMSGSSYSKPTPRAVVVCNHQSFVDIRCIAAIWKERMVIMAKDSLRYYPLLGWFMSFSGHIFVKRNDHESAIATLGSAATQARQRKISVLVFPEGTRGHGRLRGFLPFKKGAFHLAIQAQCPILPIVFSDYSHLYNKDKWIFRSGEIKAKVLPPIMTSEYTATSVDHLMELVRKRMEDVYDELNKGV